MVGSLAAGVALSWSSLVLGTGLDARAMGDMAMPAGPMPWPPGYAALIAAMWVAMMAAMMLPSAAPVVLLYAAIARQRRLRGAAVPGAGAFALGYLVVWFAFAIAAAALQWALDRVLLLTPGMEVASVAVAGLVLVAAGLYQWTPLKQACLRGCRSPLDLLLGHWREGAWGAVAMGLRQGLLCLGCCWVLMLLLFVGGVMNLLWVALLALFVLIERTAPGGPWIGRAAGLALVAWGGATLLSLT